ncbi:proton translocating inorganic pyrophosphatase, putative [Theileria equi strain WA]|uniref:Proton translocating inorganic pyrophosphatase, putative n=1 Tax=Theileria equi strain WA TaxID=1537102 RepID=L0AZS9_THEEQ|nr:proton translocating inorganic pyrophosphatase, putative [Theileria equi strain WA]AFZ81075.1 proton translocating inorganic pyrophosphatase, putative [Theileria equi strain WA]|eukprot:XP_004830741.1 proton translocating inorganic pyrophosphatase, putative [Theileria equi strain WA]
MSKSTHSASPSVSYIEEGKDSSLILKVNVKPGAKQTQVVGAQEGQLTLQIAAPPREGACNEALVEYVAEVLKLKKRSISLIHGHKSRDKVLSITGTTLSQAIQHINEAID